MVLYFFVIFKIIVWVFKIKVLVEDEILCGSFWVNDINKLRVLLLFVLKLEFVL